MSTNRHFSKRTLSLLSRKSNLAKKQSMLVQNKLKLLGHAVEITTHTSEGDTLLQAPLSSFEGKGMFVRHLQSLLLKKEGDFAVHSYKDLPTKNPEGLVIAALLKRAYPFDAWISNDSLNSLPAGSLVGTASLRRAYYLKQQRQDLRIQLIRGSVETRLSKLKKGEYQAIILAQAGLYRLGLEAHIKEKLDYWIPSAGQGVLAVECREDDLELREVLSALHSKEAELESACERALIQSLGGGCHMPLSAYAKLKEDSLSLRSDLLHPTKKKSLSFEGHVLLSGSFECRLQKAKELGKEAAEYFLNRGGASLLLAKWKDG